MAAWDLVVPPKRAEWCGEMHTAWWSLETGQLIDKVEYRCRGLLCRRCGPDMVSIWLTRIPDIWPDDAVYYCVEPDDPHWARQWKQAHEKFRLTGQPHEYLTVHRQEIGGASHNYLWSSLPLFFKGGIGRWREFTFAEAWREVRDQLCLPGPSANFPPPASLGWRHPKKRAGAPPAGWDEKVIDPVSFEMAYEHERQVWKRATGYLPGEGDPLPHPAAWFNHLVQVGIIIGESAI